MFNWINIYSSCVLPQIYSTVENFIAKTCGVIPERPLRDCQSSLSNKNISSAALHNHELKWQCVDDEVAFNFKHQSDTIVHQSSSYDEDDTINYTLSNYWSNLESQNMSRNGSIHEMTMLSNNNMLPVIGPIPVTIISRAKPPDTPINNWNVDSLNSPLTQNDTVLDMNSSSVTKSPTDTTEKLCSLVRSNVSNRFNGILFHVFPYEHQTDIVFSTQELFMNFETCFDKELS